MTDSDIALVALSIPGILLSIYGMILGYQAKRDRALLDARQRLNEALKKQEQAEFEKAIRREIGLEGD